MWIEIKNITYIYDIDDKSEEALGIKDINLSLNKGDICGIVGHTGSGKSTLMQHLNGLILPQSGEVKIGNFTIDKNSKKLLDLRKLVGLVFQYPEDQLFEEKVYDDVAFGPKNLGFDKEEVEKRVRRSLSDVGLDFERYKDVHPFELSGGEKRKVAIASVLSMEPQVLVLDEPSAGLDPRSKRELLELIKRLVKKRDLTIFFVSHNMDEIWELTEKLLIMKNGKSIYFGDSKEAFFTIDYMEELGLEYPFEVSIWRDLKENGLEMEFDFFDIESLGESIDKNFLGGDGNA